MAAGYAELWGGVEALTETELGIERATLEETLEKIKEFKVSIASALKAGSEEARRDWCKVCALDRRLLEESGRKLWTSDDELEIKIEVLCEKRERVIEINGRSITETTYHFTVEGCPDGCTPGDSFGVTQLDGIFTEDELRAAEKNVDEMLDDDDQWEENTLDVSPPDAIGDKKHKRTRVKHFHPKYTYGAKKTPRRGDCGPVVMPPHAKCRKCKGAQAIVTEKCNDIPAFIYHPERPCLAKTLFECGIIGNAWANSSILNTYLVPKGKKDDRPKKDGKTKKEGKLKKDGKPKKGGLLCGHYDSPHLFARPIVGLSLFGTKTLSFGVAGWWMAAREHNYTVEMRRGVVTIMDGYAANKINHGVPPVERKASTLLFRRMLPELLSEEWKEKNTMRWAAQR